MSDTYKGRNQLDPAQSSEGENAADIVRWPLDKEFLQNNIDRSIDFRREYYKYTITISTALLAFTISFPPNLLKVSCPALIFFAWAGLGVAVIAGVLAHDLWSRFFIAWRNHDNRGDRPRGIQIRRRITWWRRTADIVQLAALAIGVVCIVAFAGINVRNIAPKESKSAANVAQGVSRNSGTPSTSALAALPSP
jgi:hypothetical protein